MVIILIPNCLMSEEIQIATLPKLLKQDTMTSFTGYLHKFYINLDYALREGEMFMLRNTYAL